MNYRKLALLAVIALLGGLYLHYDLGQYLNLQALKERQAAIEAFRAGNPLLSVAVYFALYVVVTALSFPGAALLTLAGGAVFGLLWGTLIVSFASTIGATLAFLMSRFLLRDWVAARFGQRLAAIDQGVRREGAFYLFTLRLVPVFPFFLVNLLLGLTAMKTRVFFWVSQVGMLPATCLFVYAGSTVPDLQQLADRGPQSLITLPLATAFILLGLFPFPAKWAMWRIGSRE